MITKTNNSRNGSYKKTVNSRGGEIDLKIPRDREGEYEPQIVKKHQMDILAIEDKIIFLYSQGTSTRDIEKTMQDGIEVDSTRVSKITDKLLPMIREWQNRPLESVLFKYPEEIRRIMYTTNAIENFNRQLRKVTKTKTAFVNDDALLKLLYSCQCSSHRKMEYAHQGLG